MFELLPQQNILSYWSFPCFKLMCSHEKPNENRMYFMILFAHLLQNIAQELEVNLVSVPVEEKKEDNLKV